MKRYFLAAAMAFVCGFQLFSQVEPSVSIKLNDEERFRFEDYRLSFTNPFSSVYIGDSTGTPGLNSSENVWIGKYAGSSDTSGLHNVYIGFQSGYKSTKGANNVYIGWQAGMESDTALSNTFVGSLSGRYNTSGNINTFIGRRAGTNNTTGSENTFLGQGAGHYNDAGNCNTFVGRFAGGYNNGGDSNVFLGYQAGALDTSSNSLIIANNDTGDPLVYGSFNNKMLRFNANRMEIRNPLKNTIIGDSSGTQAYGYHNVIIGNRAGKYITGGNQNTFIGTQAGYSDNTGSDNVFVGMKSGYSNTAGNRNTFVGISSGANNTTGMRNTFVGLSAGAYNITGNYNTFIGRAAGYNNQTGNSNVFLGNLAGQYEMGSDKLYISNSETTEPLIYGDFAKNKLKFHADTVQAAGKFYAAGEIRTDQQYNINGNPGVTDSINSVTSFDFTEQKLKYRTTIFNGGIATYVSPESGWVDKVGEYFTPCGTISIIGEFSEWAGDQNMTRDPYNPDLWSTTVQFTGEDDCHPAPCDSIIKVKFREDASWDVNWGSAGFPSGTGTQDGDSIPVPLDKVYEPTIFYVTFNCKTGEYAFTDLSGYCPDSITDIRDDKKYATVLIGSQCWMAQDLNVGIRIDSTAIPTENEIIEKYCFHDLESNCTQWGGLYQWNELMDYVTTPAVQGICPAGFHVPTDAEFKILEGNVDSQFGPGSTEWNKTGYRGYDAGYNIRSTEGWSDSGNGSDAFGFHALPGGYLTDYGDGPAYYDSGCCNCYPTSTAGSLENMYNIRYMNGNASNQINRLDNNMMDDGLSLRCVKD